MTVYVSTYSYIVHVQANANKMGNTWERLASKFRDQEYRILICGLDAAGKTTALYMIKLGEVVTTIPTIGFNVETIKHRGIQLVAWDVGGRSGTRALLRHYYKNTEAIVFVIDSNDRERMNECRDDLQVLLQAEELKDCTLLVLANKQDLVGAMTTDEVREKLGLDSEMESRKIHIEGTCATKGEGLYKGLDWLASTLTSKKKQRDKSKPSWWTSLTRYFPLRQAT
ncbi:ADP-ribosylation factor 2-like [Halichondria panicea]|uniref:ADP-ribosylation factor 2-like n=1 Tax=Halichondria panicea TaxID=6063 RepID=UPI00312BB78A